MEKNVTNEENQRNASNDAGLMKIFNIIFIYPSYYLYIIISKIFNFIKKIFTYNHSTNIEGGLLDNEELNNIDSSSSFIETNKSEIKTDLRETNQTTYFAEEVANKIYNLISSLPIKVVENKTSISKIKLAKQLVTGLKEEDIKQVVHEKKHTWRYEAMNYNGKTVHGYFEAYTKADVINFLADENLIVYRIKLEKYVITIGGKHRRIKNKDLIFIITQLSTYLKSGIALSDAIGILIRQTKNANYKKIFYNVKYDLMLGESLSAAMLHQGKAFPMVLINMIKSAELTGELPEVLDDMAEYFTEIEETRKQMISALTYPTLVLVFTIFVIVFVMIYVVPRFVDIYDSMEDVKVPAFTKAVVNTSLFIEHNILWILLVVILVLLIIIYLYKNVKKCRKFMQFVMMKMPIIGNIIIYNEVTIFSKTFASLLKHNVFITDSMDILNKITNNEIYHDMILNTTVNLSKGDKISAAFQNQWAFPIPAYEMIVTGEKTGQLAEMMDKVSKYYQSLHRNSVARIKALIEPIIIILLTFGVGAVLLAVIIPMFNMYETVQQMEG